VAVKLPLTLCEVRSWEESDVPSLAIHANNRKIWRNLRDAFPHPYTEHNARVFIHSANEREPETYFAVAVDGEAVGSIGYTFHTDVERVSAQIGYWLAEPLWNRGIMTEALKAVTEQAIRTHGLTRLYAVPYEWNAASFRVLEKAGYVLEGRMRRSAIKDGQVIDQLMYAFTTEG